MNYSPEWRNTGVAKQSTSDRFANVRSVSVPRPRSASTHKTPTIDTASVDACVGTSGMHDAETCRRIRELERKVERLEHERHQHYPVYYPYVVHPPYWTYPDRTIRWDTNTYTTGDWNVSNTLKLT